VELPPELLDHDEPEDDVEDDEADTQPAAAPKPAKP
jgi:hypothetical protein